MLLELKARVHLQAFAQRVMARCLKSREPEVVHSKGPALVPRRVRKSDLHDLLVSICMCIVLVLVFFNQHPQEDVHLRLQTNRNLNGVDLRGKLASKKSSVPLGRLKHVRIRDRPPWLQHDIECVMPFFDNEPRRA
jgi:hypothetical protein